MSNRSTWRFDRDEVASPHGVVAAKHLHEAGSDNILCVINVPGNPYLQAYSVPAYSSATFPANGAFTFNRIALFLGPNVNAATASLSESSVTTIPEPASLALVVAVVTGGLLTRQKRTRRPMEHAGRVQR